MSTVVGIDDTDSRTEGMCTTYVGHLIKDRLEQQGFCVDSIHLVRLNPAAKHKTRGNAAVSLITDAPVQTAHTVAKSIVFENSATGDCETNPGVIVGTEDDITDKIISFSQDALRKLLSIESVIELLSESNFREAFQGNGRGRIGALAAIGATKWITDWTYEYISYRQPSTFGTERDVSFESVFDVSKSYYPKIWDTVDTVTGDSVAVPRTPCPILYAVRGDSKKDCINAAHEINSEPVSQTQLFLTNQGTDLHLQNASIADTVPHSSYQISSCTVTEPPERKEGGHLFFTVEDATGELTVVAFEPTKHFRDILDNLRCGDEITICGERGENNTLKIEKCKVESLQQTIQVNPSCPDCENNMSSAGANAGYRCKSCGTHSTTKDTRQISRDISYGWYEVPPCARRHIAEPLIRSEKDPIHTYRTTENW